MKRNYLIIAALSLAVAMFSCKKDIEELENTFPANLSSNGTLNSMLAQNAPLTQTITYNAAAVMDFLGTGGTKVFIPANAFVYPNQQPVVGMVTVNIVEVYNKKEKVCTGGFTTADGLPIISEGEIFIQATQNNVVLEYNPSAPPLRVLFPTNNPNPQMELFLAEDIRQGADFTMVDSSLFVTTDCTSIWTPGPPPPPAPFYYEVYSMQLGWINCDYFYNYSGVKTEVTLALPQIFNTGNTMVIAILEDFNSVVSLWTYDDPSRFEISHGYKIPINTNVKFIAMSDINGTLYWAETSQTIGSGHSTALTPQIATQAEIEQKLDALD
jgi:hypothetical protein